MGDFITIATFASALDPQFLLAKCILEENEIEHYATNENIQFMHPPIGFVPSNMCIELRIPEEKREYALRLLEQIISWP
jgi:hypothetical protein